MSLPNYVIFQGLRLGRSDQTVVGRLLRFWDTRNFKRNGELMGIIVVFVDETSTLINGFIPASIVDQFRSVLCEGHIYTLQKFEINRCMQFYKITEHPYIVRFLPSTIITVNEVFESRIVNQKFMLRALEELNLLANTSLELPDVVGLIRFVQGSNLEDASSTQRVVVRLQLSGNDTVSLTLWDDAASTFRAHVASHKTKEAVMIVTTINPKTFGDALFLNSTTGTRFYFDKDIEAIDQFMKSLGNVNELSYQCVDTTDGIKKREQLTLKELHTYVCNSNEQTQEADFVCEAIVSEIYSNNGWSYISCAACSRKLEKYGSELRCNRCVSSTVTGIVRYRVELNVYDDSDGATFVVFDSPMTSLISKTATNLMLESGEDDAAAKISHCLLGLIGKRFRFNVKVTPFNFTPKHRSFTVTSVSSVGNVKLDSNNEPVELASECSTSDGDAHKKTHKRRRT